ncbi:MAG: indole-3-glycerol phosphate synthase TrpC, partial [Candidatus Aerophobus sp.]
MLLSRILENKIREVRKRKRKVPLEALKSRITDEAQGNNFKESISRRGKTNIIAEIKQFSPSAGTLVRDFNPGKLARIYEKHGASAISILIDRRFFGGDLENIVEVRKISSLPILAKEFIIDEYQIYEARALGADAVLLIASILEREKLRSYLDLAGELDMHCLVEIHREEEWQKIKDLPAPIIGINNRDLQTLKVDLGVTFCLMQKIPTHKVVVSESGIKNEKDIERLKKSGVDAFLIGESLLRS